MRCPRHAFIASALLLAASCGRFADEEGVEVLPPSVDAGDGGGGAEPADAARVEAAAPDAAAVLDASTCGTGGWTTPNGAVYCVDDAGARIVSWSSFNHPAISPPTVPPSDDYTIMATINVKKQGEFGLVTRVRPDAGGVFFGSEYGGSSVPFLALATASTWNPTSPSFGPSYAFTPGRYRMKLRASGTTVQGKLWRADATEPASYQVTISVNGSYAIGRGGGFYVYMPFKNVPVDAVVESITIGPN